MVLTKLCPCRSLAGSMLFCHLIKCMMVMTKATQMSPRLCWWGTALISNRFCGSCDRWSSLCPLGEALFCADQAAENNVSSVKATSSKGSHEELSIRMPHWNTASFAKACCQQRLHGPLAVQRAWLPPYAGPDLRFSKGIFFTLFQEEFPPPTKCAAPC